MATWTSFSALRGTRKRFIENGRANITNLSGLYLWSWMNWYAWCKGNFRVETRSHKLIQVTTDIERVPFNSNRVFGWNSTVGVRNSKTSHPRAWKAKMTPCPCPRWPDLPCERHMASSGPRGAEMPCPTLGAWKYLIRPRGVGNTSSFPQGHGFPPPNKTESCRNF